MPSQDARKFTVMSVMIYLTERCPLDCSYCYFRHKKNREISWEVVRRFLAFVKHEWTAPASFVISGGEALMCWERVQQLVGMLRAGFPVSTIGLQTNGLLLDRWKVRWLKRWGVRVEVGIDGGFATTARWRRPMTRDMFARLEANIRHAADAGLSCGCTMTVHPDEVACMAENLRFIRGLGIRSVDITPAAFMPWDKASIWRFKLEYLRLLQVRETASILFTGEDRQLLERGAVDISLHPTGEVLLGDAFLCLPDNVRREFSLWDRRRGKLRPETAVYFRGVYARLWEHSSKKTYRDYVIFSFAVVNRMMGKVYMNVSAMASLMVFLRRAHRAIPWRRDG